MWLGLCFSDLAQEPENEALQEQTTGIAYTYSSQLYWSDRCTLVIEIQGSQQLHKSLKDLIDQLLKHFSSLHTDIRWGVAPNPTAASLLAKHNIQCWCQKSLHACLDEWPIQALPLDPKTQRSLLSCGLKTLGEFKSQASDQRIRRFGIKPNDAIKALYGEQHQPIRWWEPLAHYYQRIDFLFPIEQTALLQRHIEKALDDLERWLQYRDCVLTGIKIRLKHEKRSASSKPDVLMQIGLAEPGFHKAHLEKLIALQLESLVIGQPLTTLIVESQNLTEHNPAHQDLFNGHYRGQTWPELLDCLRTKLGPESLSSVAPYPHHQPEHSWRWTPPNQVQDVVDHRLRPTWLLQAPMPCDRNHFSLEQGPERIETGWWESNACQRDYWIAREPCGRRLWIFHEHCPRMGWFIHGIFG